MAGSKDRRAGTPGAERFSFDVASGTLWQGSRRVPVRARTAAVLRHLLERRGDVVSPAELRQVVWGKRHGSENGPKQCVKELRSLLADSAEAPRYIETVRQSGYRLIGDVELVAGRGRGADERFEAAFAAKTSFCVGRERELQEMDAAWAAARRGERPLLFIAGEPGIGKTTLIDAFTARLDARRDLWVARGQCLPHHGSGEAYGPLLTAAEQLATGHLRTLFVNLVRRIAPRLVTLLPAVFDRRELLERQVEVTGAGPEQTLRQLTHVFEQVGSLMPGIVIVEDLHWADACSCEWLCAWALRQAPANLLLIVSYRPGAAVDRGHPAQPLLAEIRRAPGFRAIELSGLATDALARYLELRFPDNDFSKQLAPVLQERTEGHALFVAGTVQDWLARGLLVHRTGKWGLATPPAELSAAVPNDVQELIYRQLAQLGESERRLLDLASAVGPEFSAADLAGPPDGVDAVERQCESLVERQLLLRRPEAAGWPNGTLTAGYRFRHALYRRVIYDAMPTHHRSRMHLRIGTRLETCHGNNRRAVAALLGDHFARGGDDRRAALYERQAAETALLRGAAREAQDRLRRALVHIARQPPGRARDSEEVRVQTHLGAAHNLIDGFASQAAAEAFERALVLARRASEPKALMPILTGLFNYRIMTNDMKAATRLAARIRRLAQKTRAPGYAMDGYNTVGYMNWKRGRYKVALSYVDKVAAAYSVRRHGALSILFGEDPGIACRYYAAVSCVMLGDIVAAKRHLAAGLRIARAIRQQFAAAEMLWSHCVVAHECGDAPLLERRATEMLKACEDGDINYWRRPGRAFAAWAAAAQGDEGGLERMAEVLKEWRAIRLFESMHYMLALYAEACLRHGRLAAADAALAEALALVRDTGECWYEADLHRLRGEVAARRSAPDRTSDPAACFRRAARLAQRQGARLPELRASVSLAELLAARGERAEAARVLAPLRPLVGQLAGLPVATAAANTLARSAGAAAA